jgi:hypothetical protein
MEIMKTSEILLRVGKINHEEIPKKAWAGKVLRYILFSILLSWITLLSSCAVGFETPDYGYSIVVPEYDSFGVLIDPWDYHWRSEHHEWIHRHPNWRHEYPRHHGGDREGEHR